MDLRRSYETKADVKRLNEEGIVYLKKNVVQIWWRVLKPVNDIVRFERETLICKNENHAQKVFRLLLKDVCDDPFESFNNHKCFDCEIEPCPVSG